MTPSRRFALWATLVALLLAGQFAWISVLRAERILLSDPLLIGGHVLLGLLLLGLAGLLATTPPDAITLPRARSNAIILLGTVALHAAALVLLWPGLSDDAVRYRLDGGMWLTGRSPYATSPEAYFAASPAAVDPVDRLVTYPRMHTIYPPLAQLAFAAARAVEDAITAFLPDSLQRRLTTAAPAGDDPVALGTHSDWRAALPHLNWLQRAGVLRVGVSCVTLLAVAVMLRALRETGRSAWWATLVAWHPLTTIETAGHAHVDALGVLLLVMMLLDVHRRRFVAAAVLLGLATCVKPHAIVLLPFLWRQAREDRQASGATRVGVADTWVPVVTLSVVALFVVPALLYQSGYVGWSATAQTYARHWEANGSVYELLKYAIGQGDDHRIVVAKRVARMLPPLVLLVAGAVLWRRRATVAEAGYWLLLLPLLVAPVAYPWYLLWPLAFVPFVPARQALPALVWATTVVLSYHLWRTPDWTLPPTVGIAQYAPVYAALAIGWALMAFSARRPPSASSPAALRHRV